MVQLNLTRFSVTSFSIAVYRMYFRSDTEAEFATHLAIRWQLYKLHTLRLRYGCGIWRYTCTIIPHEPGSKNCSTVRSRYEMAHPTRKCYRFRDKPCECFIGTLRSPYKRPLAFYGRSEVHRRKLKRQRGFSRARSQRAVGTSYPSPSLKRANFSDFRPRRVQPLKNTRLRRTNYFRWLFSFYSGS